MLLLLMRFARSVVCSLDKFLVCARLPACEAAAEAAFHLCTCFVAAALTHRKSVQTPRSEVAVTSAAAQESAGANLKQ